ncbi:MAG: DUF2586 family protein [Thermodesulfobacteriota bacterium]|nr:DUF2586 family protein [Thermodesulfobacteriota bacterium]
MASILDQLSDPILDELDEPVADEVDAENAAPNAPISPSPGDGSTVDSGARTLSVAVSDPDGDALDVSFYDASDDSLIGTDAGVASAGTASVSWGDLSPGAYSWYAVADDGEDTAASATFSFTVSNTVPNAPTGPNPGNGSIVDSGTRTLSVTVSDPDGDSLDVSFYDASDDSLIGTDAGVASGGTASVSWGDLSPGAYSWYAVADDGEDTAASATFSFTVSNTVPNAPTGPNPGNGSIVDSGTRTLSVTVSDPDGDSLDVSFYDASDDSLIGTDAGVASGGTASVGWGDLPDGLYSWYAVSDDGEDTATSSVFSFTVSAPAEPGLDLANDVIDCQGKRVIDDAAIVAGVCSAGTVGQGYLLGKSSDLEGLLGVGPLVDRLRDVFAAGGQNPMVIAVPVPAQTAGYSTTVVHSGIGPDISLTGEVAAAAEVRFKIVSGGTRNDGIYQLSIDGGEAWGTAMTIPSDGQIAVSSTGAIISVPAAPDMVTGDVYAFDLIAPAPSISGVMNALRKPLALYDVEFVYVVGPSDSVDWAAMGTQADELWNAHRPVFFLAESRLPNDGESLNDWAAALVADKQEYSHRFVAVCSAFGEVMDTSGKRIVRNWGGLAAGRIMATPAMRAIGRVRDGGISQGKLSPEFRPAMQQQLEKTGFITAKYYAGLSSACWGDGKTLADVSSDYQYLEVLRVVFKAVRKARIAALKSMYDEAGDVILGADAAGLAYLKANVETALNTLKAAMPTELADYVVTIPDGQDIVNNGVVVEMELIGIPIIRSIKLFAKYIYSGSVFDPRLEG